MFDQEGSEGFDPVDEECGEGRVDFFRDVSFRVEVVEESDDLGCVDWVGAESGGEKVAEVWEADADAAAVLVYNFDEALSRTDGGAERGIVLVDFCVVVDSFLIAF